MTAVIELARRAGSATPLELDALVAELSHGEGTAAILVRALADPGTALGAGRLLRRLSSPGTAPALVPLLYAPEPEVREAAAITLAELGSGYCSEGVPHELAEAIRRLAPIADEATAIEVVRSAERLARIAPLPGDVARQVADVLRFIPPGAPRALVWPSMWIRAARMLGQRTPPDELHEVSVGEGMRYLSALGALGLARAGIRTDVVDDWLQSTRDYHLLTPEERAQLEPLLAGSDAARAVLRALDGS